MSRNIWVISDTHFGHANIVEYSNRPFSNVEEMDEFMVTAWNETVKDGDIVYHLGDVYFGNKGAENLQKLKGRKRLILGNHDTGKDPKLTSVFQKISVWRMFPEFGLLLSHVPIHAGSLFHKNGKLKNVHGHIHENKIDDERYRCVCVEHTEYRPINIEELRVR
jgi:calcineurin-like phosphoesterase family protein